ncbi:serine/threonine protein kinase [Gordonia araii NBRC 100433]|uniref:non-specific serine/threonine protein kinase n=1 Tax=Gordonia araii NBRC 100433 TaxID=1073574 RepID=G7H158_9ACTN|nr:protein kinase [Gordonia araii]NNG96695.1 protein kinase [Gordonia araii NBRC 100433]GAB09619.1 serine/threonine protein kinase [Gordonia araii NBRC 100433]
MALAPGDVFAGYRITDVLGSGGMGTVYRVAHPRLDRDEALKTITPAPGIEDAGERFRREAKAAANLHHPGIVTIHEYGVDGDMPWYTMEYLDGDDLAKVAGQLPVGEIAESIARVASALDYAHARNVVHRDVKPANIILTRGDDGRIERVVVVDFGIAKNVTDATHLTQPFAPLGSPPYMAPEIIRGEQASPASDQYSLAVSAYQALTGHTPYSGTTGELMAAHASEAPPSITRHRPDLAAADPVLRRAMAKDAAERYSTCGEFAAALAGALADQSRETLVPTGDVADSTGLPGKPNARRKLLILAAVAVLAVAATASAVLWHRSQHPIQQPEWHVPNPPGLAQGSWTHIATAADFGLQTKGTTVCGIAAGKVYCWGTDNSRFQLGNGGDKPPNGTSMVAGQKDDYVATAISVTGDYSCAIAGPKKQVSCWGTGPLDVRDEKDKNDKQGPILDAVSVSAAPYRACAALGNGDVQCWGATSDLIHPYGEKKPPSRRATDIKGFPNASTIVTASRATCVVESRSGSVYCHGLTATGAVIDNKADFESYVQIAGPTKVTGLAYADMGSTWCATTADSVYCWGNGVNGLVGNGRSAAGPFSPTRVDGLANPTSIAGNMGYFCAAADGSAYCWGDDVTHSGRLGLPPGEYYVPTKVPGLSKVTAVATGIAFACAIADGERYCWGKPPKA